MKSSKPFLSPKAKPLSAKKLHKVYRRLRGHFGHQRWWPGDTPFEIMTGAILTQNTAWTNVEKAISNLKKAGKLSFRAIRKMRRPELARLIRPAGYFNLKAARLKSFVHFLDARYRGNIALMKKQPGDKLREELLRVNGIGPETADSILLYALDKPFFVIDLYTRRIFARHRLDFSGKKYSASELFEKDYSFWQDQISRHFPRDRRLYNDFHAQIVALGKNYCKSSRLHCKECPLNSYL